MPNRDEEDNLPEGRADAEYRVGDKKLPLHTRFKKGVSGNPKGRSKRSADNPSMTETVNRKISVTDGRGNRRAATMLEVMHTAAATKAAKGDLKALNLVLLQLEREGGRVTSKCPATPARPLATQETRSTFQEIMWDFAADMQEETYQMLCDEWGGPITSDDCAKGAFDLIFKDYVQIKQRYVTDFNYKMLIIMMMMMMSIASFKNRFKTTALVDNLIERARSSEDERV